MNRVRSIILFLSLFSLCYSQLPKSEIFLAEIKIDKTILEIKKIKKINLPDGYNNQPWFSNNSSSFYFTGCSFPNKEPHIYNYRLSSGKPSLFSHSENSEYSPKISPDGYAVSCVTVEKDSVQRIWMYDAATGTVGKCLSQETDSVGYYAWLGKDSLLYFKLTFPQSLRVLDLKSGEDYLICENPIRSFGKMQANHFYYVVKKPDFNEIMVYDITLRKATTFAIDRNKNQDYLWHPELGILKAEGASIYRYSTDSKVWVKSADFSAYGITKLSRFAFSPNQKKLVIINSE